MNPIEVLKTLWWHRIVAIPILLLTLACAVYVFQFAPRSYESSSAYAMINPDIPTESDLAKNSELEKLNTKNPYLRSSDPTLIVQVLLTRLNDSSMAEKMQEQGLSSEYTVSRGVGGMNGYLVEITGTADSKEKSIATTRALGSALEKDLYDVQKVYGADDSYLYSTILVASPDKATEQFSSRLRSLISVFLAGIVLMFGAVSVARSVAVTRNKVKTSGEHVPESKLNRAAKRDTSTVDSETTAIADPDLTAGPLRPRAKGSDDGQRLSELAR